MHPGSTKTIFSPINQKDTPCGEKKEEANQTKMKNTKTN
jgi:hypothetical protein